MLVITKIGDFRTTPTLALLICGRYESGLNLIF